MDGSPPIVLKRKHRVGNCTQVPTPRERDALRYILDHLAERGFPPSLTELGAHLYVSTDTASRTLTALQKKGYIQRDPAKHRATQVLEPALALVAPAEPDGAAG